MKERLKHYFRHTLWECSLQKKGRAPRFGIKVLRVLVLSCRGFAQDGCALRASSLTFYTLMAIVPLLALAFAIAQGFGFQEHLKEQILSRLSSNREFLMELFTFSDRLLEQAKRGVIAGAGSLVLFWSAASLLSSMESTFNRIWKVRRHRSWRRILSDYFAIILIAPLLFLLSSSLSLYVAGLFKLGNSIFGDASLFFLSWIPYLLLWLLYSLLYYLLPNTKVRFSSALWGGFIAGSLSLFIQAGYLYFQTIVTHYSAIYGSFAALPLFLIWVQVNWFLLLLGVEISCAAQTQQHWEYAVASEKMSYSLWLSMALWVAKIAIDASREQKPISVDLLVKEHPIPYSIATPVMRQLSEAGILAELKDNGGYILQRDPNALRIADLIKALQTKGLNALSLPKPREFLRIEEVLGALRDELIESPKNVYLKDL